MKKRVLVAGLAAAMVFGLMAGVVGASSAYDNWKGLLGGTPITFEGHDYTNAEGSVVLNYRKGQDDYLVSMECSGLKPGQEYDLSFVVYDGSVHRQIIGYFTADEEGIGHLNYRGLTLTYENWYEQSDVFFNIYIGGRRLVSTSESRYGIQNIAPVGSNRGKK